MLKMKKIWQKPKLIILARGRPEESVLAGCKMTGTKVDNAKQKSGCTRNKAGCPICSIVSAS